MNLYRIIEDSEAFFIRAENMRSAIKICENRYIEVENPATKLVEASEREYYHNEILQSCALIGVLNN